MGQEVMRGALSILLILGMAGGLVAQEEELAVEEEATTLQGEVIDPALYLREGRHGLEVEDLTYDAADGGQTLALLEEGTETVYLFLADEPGQDPNDLVYEYAGQRISVTGPVHERGGLRGIVPVSVESLEEAPITAPEDEGETLNEPAP